MSRIRVTFEEGEEEMIERAASFPLITGFFYPPYAWETVLFYRAGQYHGIERGEGGGLAVAPQSHVCFS